MLVHDFLTRHPGCDPRQAVAFGVQATGLRDRSATWNDLRRNFGVLGKLAITLGPASETVLAGLEFRGNLTLNSLRPFNSLLTQQARMEAAAALADPQTKPSTIGRVVNRINRNQWFRFHWRAGNPFIDPDRGVLVYICLLKCVYVMLLFWFTCFIFLQ